MGELFPILLGLLLGIAFTATQPVFLKSWWLRASLMLIGGVTATVVSGEYLENCGFVLVDCGEVALSAWIGWVAVTSLRRFLPNRHHGSAVKS